MQSRLHEGLPAYSQTRREKGAALPGAGEAGGSEVSRGAWGSGFALGLGESWRWTGEMGARARENAPATALRLG